MKTIYALLIGINEYNDPRNNLGGCVRDVQSIQSYFEAHFNHENQSFVPLVLTDQDATRSNIIAGFDLFKNAKDGDICLFHYSGHGSYCPSPKEFSHIDVNGKHQTLVCHDSRAEGGRDLLDKELSYLIWKATKDKDIHFLAIMDCCHSGSNTRSDFMLARRFSNESKVENPLADYLGIEDYSIDEDGQYTPPVGDHIQLAAASALETAKEVFFQGKSGGVFTYCLLELLKEVQNNISYSELINRIRIRIRNVVREQSPQLEVTQSKFKGLGFLSNLSTQEFSYLISFEKKLNNWVLNAGALHGITPPNKNGTTIFNLEIEEQEVKVETVFPHYSTVNNLDPLDRKKTYKAKLKSKPSKTILIGFDPNNDQDGEEMLRAFLKENPAIGFDISDDLKNSQYLIHAKQGHYFLTKLDAFASLENQKNKTSIQSIHSLFKKVKNYDQASAKEFFQCVEKLAKWKHVLELGHANSSIQSSEIKVSFAKTNYHSTKQAAIPVVALDTEENSRLNYEQHEGSWCRPAFKLNLENKGERDLWVSLLYLSSDFGIDNVLISKQKLEPGQNVSASYVSGGTRKFIIPVKLEDYYLENKIDTIQEYLKVFICTEEFETGHFNQSGVPFDRFLKENTRSLAFEAEVNKSDWTTKDIAFTIHRELEPIPEKVSPVDRETKPSKGWSEEPKSSTRPKPKSSERPDTKIIAKPKPSVDYLPSTTSDYVACSVFAPKTIGVGNEILIQAWLHLKELTDEVQKRAKGVDEEASRRASKTLNIAIKKGDRLTLQLSTKDNLEIDDPTQEIIWLDDPVQSVDFISSIPEDYSKSKAFFVLHVFKSEIPIGHIKFFVGMAKPSKLIKKETATSTITQYKKAFISYASTNRNEVLKRVQMLEQLDIPFFQDILNLNPGDNWEEELYKNIDACDVFFLFWSKAAKESKWVLKELEYAIERKKGDNENPPFIKPVPLERPMAKPPKELGHMHFNDRILYFIVNN